MAGKGSVKLSIYSTFDDGGTKKAERAIGAFTKKYGSITDTGNGAMMSISGTTRSLLDQSIQADAAAAKWDAYSAKLDDIGGKMTLFATVPLVAAGAAAFNVAADFESSMSRVSGALNDPTADMDALRQMALDMGADTIFSASQSGAAMESLAKGGLSAAQIQSGALATTMDLAAAGGLELSTAADTVVRSMGAFEMTAEESSVAANALAGAAAASSSDVADLSQGLAQCSAQAHNAGWNIQSTTGVLGAFADAGIVGSDAGTSLKTMLQRLAAPTDEAATMMESLGLNVRDGNGNMLDAASVAQELQDKIGGLASVEKDAALQTIFGSDASRAALVMTNQGRAGIEKYTAATNDQTAAQRLADSQMGDSQRTIEEMNGAIETASIQIGTSLAPVVTDAAGVAGEAAEAFAGMSEEEQRNAVATAAAVAALGPLLSVGSKVAGVVGSGYEAYGKMTAGLAKFSTTSRGAAVAAKGLDLAVSGLARGAATFAVVGVVSEVSKLAYSFTDANREAKASVDALGSVGDSYEGFGAKVEAASSMIADMNSVITSSGSTIGETSSVIAEKEAAITAIIQTALSEQRGLREEDLESIRSYNADIERLQGEKVESYQRGMQSVADSVNTEGQITADQAARNLATVQDYHDQGIADLQSFVDSRRQSIADAYYAEGSMSTEEYESENAKLNNYLSDNTAALDKGLVNSRRAIAEHTGATTAINQDTIEKMNSARDVFQNSMRVGIGDFGAYIGYLGDGVLANVGSVEKATKDMSDGLLSLSNSTNSAFLGIQLEIAESGGKITEESANTVDVLLSQFEGLPPELGDAGDKAMRALAEGLDDELGINVANATADQIIAAYRSKVGEAEVVGGDTGTAYASGLSTTAQAAVTAATQVTGMTVDQFAIAATTCGVKGDEATIAFANALANGAPISEASAAANAAGASTGFWSIDTATAGVTKGADYAYAIGSQGGLSQQQSLAIAQSGVAGLDSVDSTQSGVGFGGKYVFGLGQTDTNAAGKTLADNADSGAKSVDGSGAGDNFASGFVGAIGNWLGEAANAAADLMNSALRALNKTQDARSPSRKTAQSADWFALGFVNRTKQRESDAYIAGKSLMAASLAGADAAGSIGYTLPNIASRQQVTSALDSSNQTTLFYLTSEEIKKAVSAGVSEAAAKMLPASHGYNIHIDNARINDDEGIRDATANFLLELTRTGRL